MCRNINKFFNQNFHESQKFRIFYNIKTIKLKINKINRIFN